MTARQYPFGPAFGQQPQHMKDILDRRPSGTYSIVPITGNLAMVT